MKPTDARPSLSILLGEPNLLLRERLAAALWRRVGIWSVMQVGDRDALVRGAVLVRPDLVLADLALLREPETMSALHDVAAPLRVVALLEVDDEPYREACRRLGLDGAVRKSLATDVLDALLWPSPPTDGAGPGGLR